MMCRNKEGTPMAAPRTPRTLLVIPAPLAVLSPAPIDLPRLMPTAGPSHSTTPSAARHTPRSAALPPRQPREMLDTRAAHGLYGMGLYPETVVRHHGVGARQPHVRQLRAHRGHRRRPSCPHLPGEHGRDRGPGARTRPARRRVLPSHPVERPGFEQRSQLTTPVRVTFTGTPGNPGATGNPLELPGRPSPTAGPDQRGTMSGAPSRAASAVWSSG